MNQLNALSNCVEYYGLSDIHGVLKPGGRLILFVPDKRFTFDIRRRCTEISDVIEAYFAKRTRPSFGQIYDHFAQVVTVDAEVAWRNTDVAETLPIVPGNGPQLALDLCRHSLELDAYVDTHCSVFTPFSFFRLMREMIDLGPDVALPFLLIDFVPTPTYDMEFFVALEMLPVTPAEVYSQDVAQRLAREAGYTGAFGGGGFAAAIKADKGLRQRNEALNQAWKESRGGLGWTATRARMLAAPPTLDPKEHHDHPARHHTKIEQSPLRAD